LLTFYCSEGQVDEDEEGEEINQFQEFLQTSFCEMLCTSDEPTIQQWEQWQLLILKSILQAYDSIPPRCSSFGKIGRIFLKKWSPYW
jgi:hypothetical protein